MHKIPEKINFIRKSLYSCCKRLGGDIFFHGNGVLYEIFGDRNFVRDFTIEAIIPSKIKTDDLYKKVKERINISREIENSSDIYHFVSEGYEVILRFTDGLSPQNAEEAKQLANTSFDLNFYDPDTQSFFNPTEKGSEVSTSLRCLTDKLHLKDVVSFIKYVGTYKEIQIDPDQLTALKEISLSSFKEPIYITWEEVIEKILLLPQPGIALEFISRTFLDGAPWIFNSLVDYMIYVNVPISEDVTIGSVFEEKKLALVNVYNDFFLSGQAFKETPDELHKRLTTTLKLLFDSPNLKIPKAHISQIQVMADDVLGRCCLGLSAGGTIYDVACGHPITEEDCKTFSLLCDTPGGECLAEHPAFISTDFASIPTPTHRVWCGNQVCPPEDNVECQDNGQGEIPDCFGNFPCDCSSETPPRADYCPDGNCFTCTPSECLGGACCCCSSVDIVFTVRSRCFDQVFYSCSLDGESAGGCVDNCFPPILPETFPDTCPQCRTACDFALGEGGHTCSDISGHGGEPPPEWWRFPGKGPCNCFNQSRQGGEAIKCVTCEGLKCRGNVNVTASDCNYQLSILPSTSCCGTPNIVDIVFLLDTSGSMQTYIRAVEEDLDALIDVLEVSGATPHYTIVAYGQSASGGQPRTMLAGRDDAKTTKRLIGNLADFAYQDSQVNMFEPDFEAVEYAINLLSRIDRGTQAFFFLIGDEVVTSGGPITSLGDDAGQPTQEELTNLCNSLGITVISVQPQVPPVSETHTKGFDPLKKALALSTGGFDVDIENSFEETIEQINVDVFGASCDCVDFTSTPIQFCRGGVDSAGRCLDQVDSIPIKICVEEDNSDCNCNEDFVFNVCGEVVVIESIDDTINLECCGDLSNGVSGCNCPTRECPEEGCCGICDDTDIEGFESLEAAQEALWCECFENARSGADGLHFKDNVVCGSDCIAAPLDCTIRIPDGFCDFKEFTREEILDDIEDTWNETPTGGEVVPPSLSEATCQPECDRLDQAIATSDGCGSLRNPSVAVLNNGVGLVAYESWEENNSVIRISQFRTSVPAKILPNRPSNKGRLENFSRWASLVEGSPKVAKLYYYEPIPIHFMNGISDDIPTDPPPVGLVTDIVVFKNGPFQNQCFPLFQGVTASSVIVGPTGSDDVGNYILFIVGDNFGLSNPFPSTDDVYNIEWFLIDRDDAGENSNPLETGGLTGSTDPTSLNIPQEDLLTSVLGVDELLYLGTHTHDGQAIPVANPSIAVAHNYANSNENSHFVYVVYQALEDEKWNLYLRQLRLSEYSRDVQLSILPSEAVSLNSLGISELIYRVVCVNDDCSKFGSDSILSRSIVMEVLTLDRREVFNADYVGRTDKWSGLCSGSTDSFPKKKVYAQFTHSVVADICADQFGFNEIFYNWNPGDEFTIPFSAITATSMFLLIRKNDDNAVDLGQNAVSSGGVNITLSQAGAIWFEDPEISNWVTVDTSTINTLMSYKGLDRSDPIPITEFETGHCTHPVIKLNSNNDLFVAYECTDTEVQQIHLLGTAVPSSSLPLGIFTPKNPDVNLDYFLTLDDFTYNQDITSTTNGINQLPDIFIDLNNVIHLAWQSNRDNYWEIYYATLDNNFINKRITNYNSKSLKPSITGDDRGNIHIAWHDNRFGNWEIMMGYKDGERIDPLSEQDPYMASARNKANGYEHHIDSVPLTLENTTNDVICVNSLLVFFYEDRLLRIPAFDILQTDWPFAFEVPSVQTDRTSFESYLGAWDTTVASGLDFLDFDFPLPIETLFIGPEFDSSISSEIEKITATIDALQAGTIYISFRGSDLPDDPNADLQWSSWANLSKHWNSIGGNVSREVFYNDLMRFEVATGIDTTIPLERVFGRYKQIRINTDNENLISSSHLSSLITHSVSGRLCLAPGDTITAYLDLTPEIRINQEGNQVSEIPLPLKINKNQTYFIGVSAFSDSGLIKFGDQQRSVSCETCSRSVSSWESTSCSVFRDINNEETSSMFFDVRFRFYTDRALQNLVAQFETFSESDLKSFTVAGDTPADTVWSSNGYEMLPGISRRITLWPTLSNTSGLLCGVTYWVQSSICMSDEPEGCARIDLASPQVFDWDCKCESTRWDDRFEDAPVNLRQAFRWSSSGDGFSDTRLTETKIGSTVNNFNPIIRIRNDLTGIVLYESNRTNFNKDTDPCPSDFNMNRIYSSVFSVFPSDTMYASGAESVRSFNDLLIKSDIPITACDGNDCDDSLIKIDGSSNPQFVNQCALEGRNPALALDQYNNIFSAFESPADQTTCAEFSSGQGNEITVHTCGANAKNLSFNLGETAEGGGVAVCSSNEILNKAAPIIDDKIMKKIIRLVRVKNEYASYHITRNKKASAVVDKCSIMLEVIVEPDVVAVRVRNENLPAWSTWYPFDPEVGDYTMQIPWELSVSSGVKTVTVQAATYQGLSVTFSVTIIADYKTVEHAIRFFKSTEIDPPVFGDDSIPVLEDFGNENDIAKLFDPDEEGTEELPSLEGIPIAGLRPPALTKEDPVFLENKTGEYIFVQFDPSSSYFSQFTEEELALPTNAPTFDVLQQGQDDKFALGTVYHQASQSFRGVISIKRDDKGLHQDGLAFVIPHFERDCGDVSIKLTDSKQYSPNIFNIMASQAQIEGGEIPTDIFASERDQTGRVEHKITIRPLDDPYFIFGDPNYHLKKENE